MKTGCVIPCHQGGEKTLKVVGQLLNHQFIDLIVVVDDYCPFRTGDKIQKTYSAEGKVKVIFNAQNLGVGGATNRGIKMLFDNHIDIIIKIDADGQMNPSLIPALIQPILQEKSEAAKGNRFTSIDHILSMPKTRIIGNLALSFLNKASTGYWELFDPTNGFVAFKASALKRVRIDKTDDRYFFESDLLFQCSLAQITFAQLPMNSVYGGEISSLKPMHEIGRFAGKHLINFLKRLVYQYFILDFNAGSLELLGGIVGLIVSTGFSIKIFTSGILYDQYATPGESSLFAILAIITIQMFIGFLYYDTTQQPLMRQLRSKR
jgi:dolichol-phosphate mannosyltransferase